MTLPAYSPNVFQTTGVEKSQWYAKQCPEMRYFSTMSEAPNQRRLR